MLSDCSISIERDFFPLEKKLRRRWGPIKKVILIKWLASLSPCKYFMACATNSVKFADLNQDFYLHYFQSSYKFLVNCW